MEKGEAQNFSKSQGLYRGPDPIWGEGWRAWNFSKSQDLYIGEKGIYDDSFASLFQVPEPIWRGELGIFPSPRDETCQ